MRDIDRNRHADHLRRCTGHSVRLSPSTTTRISPSDRLHPTAPHTSAPTAHRTAPPPPRRSFGDLRSPVARAAPFEPRTAALTDRKVAARFEVRPGVVVAANCHSVHPPRPSSAASRFCGSDLWAEGEAEHDDKPPTATPAAISNRHRGSSSRPALPGLSFTSLVSTTQLLGTSLNVVVRNQAVRRTVLPENRQFVTTS